MNQKQQLLAAALLIATCVLFRVVCNAQHWLNFAPMIALSLFLGYIIKDKKVAVLASLVAVIASDVALAMYNGTPAFYGDSQYITYLSYAIIAIMGSRVNGKRAINVLGYTIGAGIVFFVVSNIGVWLDTTYNLYPKTFGGLSTCFYNAVLFYRDTLKVNPMSFSMIADVAFSAIFFGTYSFAINSTTSKQLA
jgi:hypothetical protein